MLNVERCINKKMLKKLFTTQLHYYLYRYCIFAYKPVYYDGLILSCDPIQNTIRHRGSYEESSSCNCTDNQVP
jgi:hypothetical protein